MDMASSDIRLKQDIRQIGTHPLGFGIYLFSYRPEAGELFQSGRHLGVMAQEVEAVIPAAMPAPVHAMSSARAIWPAPTRI